MIAAFFEDSEIFVTGGSGTVGKALIEKLLRSTNIRRIYMLLRVKKNLSIEERMKKIREAKIFKHVRASKPEALDKLIAIPGDATLPNLGITPEYAQMMENVTVVFHSAATVSFVEPLDVAINLNVGATLEALKFAETLKNLKCFLHVSTFYCHTYTSHVEDKIYEPPMDWRICLKLAQNKNNRHILDFVTRKAITGFPNTYSFTKNLAESLVNDYRDRLPVAIYRPSIVLHALKDPEPGFTPTIMGAMGLFALVGAGILKSVFLSPKTHFDITPLDTCTKSMIYYAVRRAEQYKNNNTKTDVCPVFMTSSWGTSPHTFLEMCLTMDKNNLWHKASFEKSFMIPHCIYTDSRFGYKFLLFIKQILPCLLVDTVLKLLGRPPVLMGVSRKAYIALEVMKPFMFNTYTSTGISCKEEMLQTIENSEFGITNDINRAGTDEGLVETCQDMVFKIREVLFKEDPKTIPRAQKILKMKIIAYNVFRAIFAFYLLHFLYRKLCNYMEENYV